MQCAQTLVEGLAQAVPLSRGHRVFLRDSNAAELNYTISLTAQWTRSAVSSSPAFSSKVVDLDLRGALKSAVHDAARFFDGKVYNTFATAQVWTARRRRTRTPTSRRNGTRRSESPSADCALSALAALRACLCCAPPPRARAASSTSPLRARGRWRTTTRRTARSRLGCLGSRRVWPCAQGCCEPGVRQSETKAFTEKERGLDRFAAAIRNYLEN